MDRDDASCFNLNRISQPSILGVDPHVLARRFSFATRSKFIEVDRWLALDSVFAGGAVPAIADQTVIQWGLGKKIGDALIYQSEQGDTLRLLLITRIKSSVFQGHVLSFKENFPKNFPSQSGSKVFLVEIALSRSEAVAKS